MNLRLSSLLLLLWGAVQFVSAYKFESGGVYYNITSETNMTAADIASVCGYPTAQYFAHQFTQTFDTTPNAWRTTRQKRLRRAAEPKGDGP